MKKKVFPFAAPLLLLAVPISARADVAVGPMVAVIFGIPILMALAMAFVLVLVKRVLFQYLKLDAGEIRRMTRFNLILWFAAILLSVFLQYGSDNHLVPILVLGAAVLIELIWEKLRCPRIFRHFYITGIVDFLSIAAMTGFFADRW